LGFFTKNGLENKQTITNHAHVRAAWLRAQGCHTGA